MGLGSGILMDAQGHILTNHHVIRGATTITAVESPGEVIGVNTTIVSQTGGFEGLAFAIPSNMALAVARALIASGKVERAWFGVEVHDVTHAEAQGLGLPAIQCILETQETL